MILTGSNSSASGGKKEAEERVGREKEAGGTQAGEGMHEAKSSCPTGVTTRAREAAAKTGEEN